MQKKYWLLLVLLFSIIFDIGCKSKKTTARLSDSQMSSINVNGNVLSNVSSDFIKFSFLKDENGNFSKIYIQDAHKYEFHYQFLQTLPEFKGLNQKEIEGITYRDSQSRKAYIGMLVLADANYESDFPDDVYKSKFYVLADTVPDAKLVRFFMDQVSSKFSAEQRDKYGLKENLRLDVVQHQEENLKLRAAEFQSVGIPLRFGTLTQSTYTAGWGVGKVYVAKTEQDVFNGIAQGNINSDTILIVDEALRTLPPVAGVISGAQLTAGSHLVLLAQMYGIPLVAKKNAATIYAGDTGKLALLASDISSADSVGGFEYFNRLTPSEWSVLKRAHSRTTLTTTVDKTTSKIVKVSELARNQVAAYGGKATQYGFLARTIPENINALAVGVPIYYYQQYLDQAKTANGQSLGMVIANLLSQLRADSSYVDVERTAQSIRDLMQQTEIPAPLLATIRTALNVYFPAVGSEPRRLKIRSSSNVEDGAEFNGAGLYESDGGCFQNCADKPDDFKKSLNKVWRSLFTARGLWARKQFGVVENQVGMGVLVHEPFKDELYNGVIKVKKIGKQVYTEITTQKGEEASVTNAVGTATAEVSSWTGTEAEKVFSIVQPYPQYTRERSLMSQSHYLTLFNNMMALTKQWSQNSENLEIEAEWKVVNQNNASEKIFFKQVRAVPKPRAISLDDNGSFYYVTGDELHLHDDVIDTLSSFDQLFRISRARIKLKAFSSEDLKNKRLQFGDGIATIREKEIPIKLVSYKIDTTQNGTNQIPVNALYELQDKSKLNITFTINSKPTHDVAHDLNASYLYTGSLLNNDLAGSFESDTSNSYVQRVQIQGQQVSFAGEDSSCAIQVTAQRNGGAVMGDEVISSYDYLIIKSLISRDIVIKGEGNYAHTFKKHDGANNLSIDLLSDASLSEAERAALLQNYGQYLYLDLSLSYQNNNSPNAKEGLYTQYLITSASFLDAKLETKNVKNPCSKSQPANSPVPMASGAISNMILYQDIPFKVVSATLNCRTDGNKTAAVVSSFQKGAVLTRSGFTQGAERIVMDERNLPWVLVNSPSGPCYVSASYQFISP